MNTKHKYKVDLPLDDPVDDGGLLDASLSDTDSMGCPNMDEENDSGDWPMEDKKTKEVPMTSKRKLGHNRTSHPAKMIRLHAYVPVELAKAAKAASYGNATRWWTATGVIAIALQDAPEVSSAAMSVLADPLPVAVERTRKAILGWLEKTLVAQYWAALSAAEKAEIMVRTRG